MSNIILRNYGSSSGIPRHNHESRISSKKRFKSHPKIRIFISYSHDDFSMGATRIRSYISKTIPDSYVYFDKDKLVGEDWKRRNYDELKHSNMIIVILTPAALHSKEIKKEVMLSKKLDKIIIPCKDENLMINWDRLPWNLGKFDGIDFGDIEIFKRELYGKIMCRMNTFCNKNSH